MQYEEKQLTPLAPLLQAAVPLACPWAKLAQLLTPRATTTCRVQCCPKWVLKDCKSGSIAVLLFSFLRQPWVFVVITVFPLSKREHFVLEDVLSVISPLRDSMSSHKSAGFPKRFMNNRPDSQSSFKIVFSSVGFMRKVQLPESRSRLF